MTLFLMLHRRRILLTSFAILLLAGCATSPKEELSAPPPTPENPAILQAEADLEEAQSLEAEWNVRLNPGDSETRSLTEILALAKQAQENGNTERATLLAQKVTQFARLGINQAIQQQDALPYYPQ